MDVLSSRILIRPRDLTRSQHFYRDVLGLAVSREFGPSHSRGQVYFLGNSLLEVAGSSTDPNSSAFAIWIQVRDVAAERDRLSTAGVNIDHEPRQEPWGLIEMWLSDPDGLPICLVEVPAEHPLRRDSR